jgi:hypothetical protein
MLSRRSGQKARRIDLVDLGAPAESHRDVEFLLDNLQRMTSVSVKFIATSSGAMMLPI